jgi:putative redox protein
MTHLTILTIFAANLNAAIMIVTQYISDYEYTSTNGKGHTVQIDMREGDKTHMGPMEMVLSALSGCVAVEVALLLKKRRKQLVDMKIIGTGNRRTTPPRSYTDITLNFVVTSPDATLEELTKIATLSLEKYCSVADSLKAPIAVLCEIVRP